MTIGIYKITNIETNNTYIGQSKNIERRWKEHIKDLSFSTHHNYYLQKEFNKYKDIVKRQYKDNEMAEYLDLNKLTIDKYYKFNILESFEIYNESELLTLEDKYILKYRSIDNGYRQKTNVELNNEYTSKTFILFEEFKDYKDFMLSRASMSINNYTNLHNRGLITKKEISNRVFQDAIKNYNDYISSLNEENKNIFITRVEELYSYKSFDKLI